jgi:LysM repeat protein
VQAHRRLGVELLMPSGTTATEASSGKRSSTPASVSSSTSPSLTPGAHHDLAVHLDAVVEQRPQPAQAHAAAPVAQHPVAHVGSVAWMLTCSGESPR